MRQYLIQHCDALIQIVLGLGITAVAWRHREKNRNHSSPFVRHLPKLGLAVAAVGLLFLILPSLNASSWKRVYSSDRRASAEFPIDPTIETVTDPSVNPSAHSTVARCKVPSADVALFLTWTEIPPDSSPATFEQRLDAIEASYPPRGITVTSSVLEQQGTLPGCRLNLDCPKNVRSVVRIVVGPDKIYSALATTTPESQNDPAATHFLDSFRVDSQSMSAK